MKLVLTCLFILVAIEAYLAPFTKVEESFNLQATYDILHSSFSNYDHIQFPGVVPRTFVGATLLSILSYAFIPFLDLLQQQVLVRVLLGGCVVLSIGKFCSDGVSALFGRTTARITILLMLCQFHLVFWVSRTLPNMFGLPWVELGLSHWLISLSRTSDSTYQLNWMIRYLTFAGIVFRFEIGILLVILVLTEIYYGRLSFVASIKQMVVTAIISLIITVPLDSFFWNQWIWPEGIVFYFNVILNKSSQWGTLPFYAYFLKFLPRLLLISFPLSALAYVIDSRVKRMLTPMLIYVAVFSCLPHKEWRFIVYTLPVFTVAAAASVTWFINRACRSLFYRMVLVGVAVSYVISFMVSLSAFQISRHNYPGGEALFTLHQIEKDNQVRVHLDTETAMTGASLFGQTNPNWVYSKNETHHSQHDFIEGRYTHLITSRPEKFDTSLFEVIDQTYGIDKVELKSLEELIASIKQFDFSYLNVKLVPKLFTIKLIDPQKTWVQSTLRKYPVVLYSKTYCPYCKAAKQLISKYCDDIHVIEVDLEQDARDIQQALYDLTGQYTFPNLFQNQISLGGFDRLSELDRKGELNLCKK
ncbi:hypothetical protein INT48_004922 [Thamnidium elegans]|uniref:Mannosyltransferase n=1 Tax=Thamnidium elegans TaxID=101142 RepID=A0A8H7SIP6_9FUNG|nr:hypothetical protein INT48_004922 [Thamnidium elegans]